MARTIRRVVLTTWDGSSMIVCQKPLDSVFSISAPRSQASSSNLNRAFRSEAGAVITMGARFQTISSTGIRSALTPSWSAGMALFRSQRWLVR